MNSPLVAVRRAPALAKLTGVWAASRLVLLALALFVGRHYHRSFHDTIVWWDGGIYESIAQHGYTKLTDFAWPPLVVLGLRGALAVGVPSPVYGLVLSAVSSWLAAVALYRLAGPRYGMFAAAAWLLAPPTVFTFVLYSEAPFCAAAFWAWERMRRGKWLQMGLLLGLACGIRVTGVFLCAGAFVWLLTTRRDDLRGVAAKLKALCFLLIPAAVLLTFEVYLYVRFHDWLAWYHAQTQGWYRQFAWPWQILRWNFQYVQPGAYRYWIGFAWVHRFEFVSLFVGIAVAVAMGVRKRWGELTYVGLQVLALGTSLELAACNRGTLMWWPLWILVGELLYHRRRDWLVQGVYWLGAPLVAGAWAWVFFNGLWAG